jgi:hypothetical protein
MKKSTSKKKTTVSKLPPQLQIELQELQRMERMFSFVADEVRKNTALVPKGKVFRAQLDAVTELIKQYKSAYISAILKKMGIAKAEVNMYTGEITPV